MFGGVAGWFAAGAEEALLSGSGARTSCEASGAGFAGCSILASICGGAGGGLEGVCCGVFLTGEILTLVATRGSALAGWLRVCALSAGWLGVLTAVSGDGSFAAIAGPGAWF